MVEAQINYPRNMMVDSAPALQMLNVVHTISSDYPKCVYTVECS